MKETKSKAIINFCVGNILKPGFLQIKKAISNFSGMAFYVFNL